MSIMHDLALTFSPHWSHNLARDIAQRFPHRSLVFATSKQELSDRLPTHPQWVEDFIGWREQKPVEHYANIVKEKELVAINRNDERYPPLLQQIHEPPLVLFVEGILPRPSTWCAMVGSREATAYGRSQAFTLAKETSERNVNVITGLARGIDEYTVRGACAGNGTPVAVLAGGHAQRTSREKELSGIIRSHGGAIISEHPPHIAPQRHFFPIRNRIIAGIAERILVVEAALKSGSMISAYAALKEGREVFALPGPVTNKTSEGCHALIRDGATICTSIYDLLNIPKPKQEPKTTKAVESIPLSKIISTSHNTPEAFPTPFHENLWEFLQSPRSFDSLVEYAKEKGSEVAGILNIWEIEGYLALKNGRYHLVPYEHSSHC